MQRQHRAAEETACLRGTCNPAGSAPLDPAFPGAAFDGPEPPIEIDASLEPPGAAPPSAASPEPAEAQLISYLGDLPSPTDPAFDVFGTIMLPDELAIEVDEDE
jgi:hypothetical protein